MNIESLEQWEPIAERLRSKGYHVWQTQYDFKMPEGFHAWFICNGLKDVEIVTHNEAVCEAIIKFNDDRH